MNNDRQTLLLKMHNFYAEEARHQRSMMWTTARWFVLILGVIFGVSFKYILDPPINFKSTDHLILLVPIALGYIISFICIILTRSFYKTNLIYISMFAKIEEELNFNQRTNNHTFRSDPYITWQTYNDARQTSKSSEEFVKKGLKYSGLGMYTFMSFVFICFSISFVTLTIWVLAKARFLNKLFTIVTLLIFVVFSLMFVFYLIKRIEDQ